MNCVLYQKSPVCVWGVVLYPFLDDAIVFVLFLGVLELLWPVRHDPNRKPPLSARTMDRGGFLCYNIRR